MTNPREKERNTLSKLIDKLQSSSDNMNQAPIHYNIIHSIYKYFIFQTGWVRVWRTRCCWLTSGLRRTRARSCCRPRKPPRSRPRLSWSRQFAPCPWHPRPYPPCPVPCTGPVSPPASWCPRPTLLCCPWEAPGTNYSQVHWPSPERP